jgi:hypothetical protein
MIMGDRVGLVFWLATLAMSASPEAWFHSGWDGAAWRASVGWTALAVVGVVLMGLIVCWPRRRLLFRRGLRRRKDHGVWRTPGLGLADVEGMSGDRLGRRCRRRRYDYYRFYHGLIRDL